MRWHRIPAEVVADFVFAGTSDDIIRRIEEYKHEGLDHVVLGNFTGMVGGLDEFQRRLTDSMTLTRILAEL